MLPRLTSVLRYGIHEEKMETSRANLCMHRHLLQDLLDILVGGFYYIVQLWSVQTRIVMLNPGMHVEFCDHSIVKIGTLSVMILSGMPYRHIRLCLMNWAITFLVTEANKAASTHFMK